MTTRDILDKRACTCHPDDNPPRPCPRKFAYSECVAAAVAAPTDAMVEAAYRKVWGITRSDIPPELVRDVTRKALVEALAAGERVDAPAEPYRANLQSQGYSVSSADAPQLVTCKFCGIQTKTPCTSWTEADSQCG